MTIGPFPIRPRTWVLGAVSLFVLWLLLRGECWSVWVFKGVRVPQCPDGDMRPTAYVQGMDLVRGGDGKVRVGAVAWYVLEGTEEVRSAPIRRFDATLVLVDGTGKETPLAMQPSAESSDDGIEGGVKLPEVPDGDYLLRAKVHTRLGDATADAPLALYAPARIHVLTDRPLYEPGNLVRFRAVALRARDLAPMDGRPGRWIVLNPAGETVLEEKTPAGAWGVAAGSLPLDSGADTGEWTVRWTSGDASDQVAFRVEPFTLPRFRVEASASKTFYTAGEKPKVSGSVVYSSGAPVADAKLSIQWRPEGDWPWPSEWAQGALPTAAAADRQGRFSLDLPELPRDLRGRATLHAEVTATDPAGDRVGSGVSVLLSEDRIQTSAVTELADGLVQGFNNRLFLRVASAAGHVLPGASVHVRRAWDASDPGIDAVADEDGVASLQIDPGPPVNVVIPPMPARKSLKTAGIRRGDTKELVRGEPPGLADQRALDGWLASMTPCARFVDGGQVDATLAVRADSTGAVLAAVGDDTPLGRCLAEVARTKRLAQGADRLYTLKFSVDAPALPNLIPVAEGPKGTPDALEERIRQAALDARTCLPADLANGDLPRALTWRTRAGSREVLATWVRSAGTAPESVMACVQQKIRVPVLSEPAATDALGLISFGVAAAPDASESRPQATTMLGYEFVVSAKIDGRDAGSTKLRIAQGSVPSVRLRATPALPQPGGEVAVEILRGKEFVGTLPEKLELTHGEQKQEAPLDEKTRTAKFKLPPDAEGWFQVQWNGARAVVFVRPSSQLAVRVSPDRERYAPGETARLDVRTTAGERPTQAAVGLFGIDESLSQLASLAGPGDMERVRAPVQTESPAFGILDGQALAMGRIRGPNAAAATILRVGEVSVLSGKENPVSVANYGQIDSVAELTDAFYEVLAELHARTREWEKSAPAAEQMHPATMAKLWEEALSSSTMRGKHAADGFGRALKLHRLPEDLLALVDPRAVVVAGTRLPEDVENWAAFVAKERP